MKKFIINNSLPIILLLLVSALDYLAYTRMSTIQSVIIIREIMIAAAFIIIAGSMFSAKWLQSSKVLTYVKTLLACVTGIYASFAIPKLFFLLNDAPGDEGFIFSSPSLKNLLYLSTSSIVATLFSLFILLIIKNLIYARRRRTTRRNFIMVIVVMLMQILYLNFQERGADLSTDLAPKDTGATFLLILLIISIVINSFKTSWVNYLTKKEKLACLIWGLLLIPPSAMLLNFPYHDVISHYSVTLGIFLRQVSLFLVIYWSISLLSILLHLPTAGIYDRRRKEVESLHKMSRSISLEFDPDKLVDEITKESNEVIEANAFWLELYSDSNDQFKISSSIHLTVKEKTSLEEQPHNQMNRTILASRDPVQIDNIAGNDHAKSFKKVNKNIQSLLGVPLISYDTFLGILYAVHFDEFGFSADDLNMLRAFADQAAVALENARLVEESILKQKLEQELKIAHDAQMKLLPKSMPEFPGLDMDAICVTANEVGGDYYDFFEMDDNKLGIVIGDVSGKGPEAAFYMAEVKGIIESLSRIYSSPKDLLIQTNHILYQNFEKGMFVTLIYAVIDMKRRKMTFCRAGHCPVIHYSAVKKEIQHIEPNGLGVGFEQGSIFQANIVEKTVSLKNNDIFLFYTDGIIETRNEDAEEFDESGLEAALSGLSHLPAEKIRKRLVEKVISFGGSIKPHDDLSMVVVKISK